MQIVTKSTIFFLDREVIAYHIHNDSNIRVVIYAVIMRRFGVENNPRSATAI